LMSPPSRHPVVQCVKQNYVSPKALRRIEIGKQALRKAKDKLIGAGNLESDLIDTGGETDLRTDLAYEITEEYDNILGPLKPQGNEAQTAYAAKLAGAGNCDHNAAIAYRWLGKHGDPEDKISRCTYTGLNHTFVVIGDWKTESHRDCVVVDPWPTKAEVCLLTQHQWYESPADDLIANVSTHGKRFKHLTPKIVKVRFEKFRTPKQKKIDLHKKKFKIEKLKEDNPGYIWNQLIAHKKGSNLNFVAK
jgi:hypothetical protein